MLPRSRGRAGKCVGLNTVSVKVKAKINEDESCDSHHTFIVTVRGLFKHQLESLCLYSIRAIGCGRAIVVSNTVFIFPTRVSNVFS
jgi:hypothetical protein